VVLALFSNRFQETKDNKIMQITQKAGPNDNAFFLRFPFLSQLPN